MLIFSFFLPGCNGDWSRGAGSQEPGVTTALAVPAPTVSIPCGLTMEEFNLPLITEAQRKLRSGLNIPLLSTLLQGHGLCGGAMAHGHQCSLTYSARNAFSPASAGPRNPSAPSSYLLIPYGMIFFALPSRTHAPGELSCLTGNCPRSCPAQGVQLQSYYLPFPCWASCGHLVTQILCSPLTMAGCVPSRELTW